MLILKLYWATVIISIGNLISEQHYRFPVWYIILSCYCSYTAQTPFSLFHCSVLGTKSKMDIKYKVTVVTRQSTRSSLDCSCSIYIFFKIDGGAILYSSIYLFYILFLYFLHIFEETQSTEFLQNIVIILYAALTAAINIALIKTLENLCTACRDEVANDSNSI